VPSTWTADEVVTLFALRGPTGGSEKERKVRRVMKRNEGSIDRGIRIVLGVSLAVLAFFVGVLWLKVALGVLAGIALFTGLSGFCLLYVPFGISTCRCSDKKEGSPSGCCP
jgi:hypothetical protein